MYCSKYSIISWLPLLVTVWAKDNKLFTSRPAFDESPYPTIPIQCQELGSSGSYLDRDHSQDGEGYFPALSWPNPTQDTREYLLVSEDPDAPLPESIIHGIYYGIPRVFTGLQHPDFFVDQTKSNPYLLRGGFKYGKNQGGSVYLPPRPPRGHGPHRYFFELIALNGTIDQSKLSELATLEEISHEIEGKVAAWGAWVGIFERV